MTSQQQETVIDNLFVSAVKTELIRFGLIGKTDEEELIAPGVVSIGSAVISYPARQIWIDCSKDVEMALAHAVEKAVGRAAD